MASQGRQPSTAQSYRLRSRHLDRDRSQYRSGSDSLPVEQVLGSVGYRLQDCHACHLFFVDCYAVIWRVEAVPDGQVESESISGQQERRRRYSIEQYSIELFCI